MEPIPRPLSRKLALTLLVGAGCFLTGLVFWFSQKDKAFFLLSSVIFLCSCIRAASLFRKIRGKSYLVLEGICTGYCPKLFVKYREIYLLDAEGVPHTLFIGRDRLFLPLLFPLPARFPQGGQPLAGKGNAGRQPAWDGASGKCTRFRNRIPLQYGPVKSLYHPVNSIKRIKYIKKQ